MSALSVQPPFPIFTEPDGLPLEDGYVWIGTANLEPQTNPIAVFWDADLTQPAAQPIRTLAGYPSRNGTPARLYVNSDYSIRVMNKNGSVVYSAPAATERYSDVVVGSMNAEDVIYDPPFIGSVQTNVEAKLAQYINVKDFGVVGDGVADDTTAMQNAVNSAAGKVLQCVDGETYKLTDSISILNGITIDLAGSTVNFNLASTVPGFSVRADNVEIFGGTINVVGAFMGGDGAALNCITAGVQATGVGYKNLTFRDLTCSTNRNDAGATIGILGECTNVLIENITIPDNANCRNIIGCEWGGTPVGGTGHPHNIVIRNIKIGRLTYPTYGSSGYAYAVWLSAAFNVKVENVTMIEGYGLVMAIRGDNANTYAPASYKDQVGTGITVDNCSISECFGYGIRAIGSHRSATLDNIPMSVQFRNITVKGAKVGANNNFGFSAEQSNGVILDGFKFYGVTAASVVTGINNDNLVIQNGEIYDCQLYAISLGNSCRWPVVKNVKMARNNSLGGAGTFTAAITLVDTIQPNIEGCIFSEIGSTTETQKYSITATAATVRPKLNNNHTYALAASGVGYLINVSTTPEIMATGSNNTAEPGIANVVGGAPIFRINGNGQREFDFAAAPTGGAYLRGDRVYFYAPSAGGNIGAVCTTSGTPGTWKTFGSIAA